MKLLICIFCLLLLAGCGRGADPWEMGRIRRAYIEQNPQLPEEVITNIYDARISLGMNGEQVILCIGKPGKIKNSTWESGEKETWEYGYFQLCCNKWYFDHDASLFYTKYLYFENDKLVGWQD